jgi:tetratricopeptide (TPR) repeat protein
MAEKQEKDESIKWKAVGGFIETLTASLSSIGKDPKTTSGLGSLIFLLITLIASIIKTDFWGNIFVDIRTLVGYWYIPLSALFFLVSFAFYLYYVRKKREIKEPFPYTYTVEAFEWIDSDIVPEEFGKEIAKCLKHLSTDLSVMLNQKIKRLSPKVKSPDRSEKQPGKAHILIRGKNSLRNSSMEVFPSVIIFGEIDKENICQPIRHDIRTLLREKEKGERKKDRPFIFTDEYEKIKEKTYFYVASLIYSQIMQDVKRKIDKLPTNLLRAQACFYEGQDFLYSNTLEAYDSAISLFRKSLQYYEQISRPFYFLRRREIDLGKSKAYTGLSKALLFRQILANMSGKKDNPVFESLHLARKAEELVKKYEPKAAVLPRYGEERTEEMAQKYDVELAVAMAYSQLDAFDKAFEYLLRAAKTDYTLAMDDSRWWYVRADCEDTLESKNRFFAKVTDMDPRFETGLFSSALLEDYLMRTRAQQSLTGTDKIFSSFHFERAKGKYGKCIKVNPGNLRAYANLGYISWLNGDLREAERYFEEPEGYITGESYIDISTLRYGLGRLYFEISEKQTKQDSNKKETLKKSLHEYTEACSANPNVAFHEYTYFYEYFNDALMKRYEKCFSRPRLTFVPGGTNRLGRRQTSREEIDSLLAPYVCNDLANAYFSHYYFQGDILSLNKACIYYKKAIDYKSDFGPAYLNLAKAYDFLDGYGLFVESVKYALKANDLEPNWAEARNYCIDRLIAFLIRLRNDPDSISDVEVDQIILLLSENSGWRDEKQGDRRAIIDKWVIQKINKALEDLKEDFVTEDLKKVAQSLNKKIRGEIVLQKRHLDAFLQWLRYHRYVKERTDKEGTDKEIQDFYDIFLKDYLPGYYLIHKELLDIYLEQLKELGIEAKLGTVYGNPNPLASIPGKKAGGQATLKDLSGDIREIETLPNEHLSEKKEAGQPTLVDLSGRSREIETLANEHFDAYEKYCKHYTGLSENSFAWLYVLADDYRKYNKKPELKFYLSKIENAFKKRFDESQLPSFYYVDLAYANKEALPSGKLPEYCSRALKRIDEISVTKKTKAVVFNRIGNLFFEKFQDREAIPYYEKAIDLDGRRPIYECNLGRTYGNLGKWHEMIKHCLRAVDLRRSALNDPYGLDYYYEFLAEGYFEAGRLREFEDSFERSDDLPGPEKKAIIYDRIGNLLFEKFQDQKAIPYYEKAIGLDSQQPIYECDLGRTYGNLGQWGEMINHCRKAVELRRKIVKDPYGAEYYYEFLAEAYFRANRLGEFENFFERSDDLRDPEKKAIIYNRIGNLFYETNRQEEALLYFEKALKPESDPIKKAVIYNRIGNLFFENDQDQKAIPYYEKAIELDGQQPIYECNLGRTYEKGGQWDKMINHCLKAVELRRNTPNDPYGLDYYYDFLSEAYFKAGRLKEFEELFEASGDLKDEPEKKAVIYNRIGNVFFGVSRNSDAIPYYEKAITFDNKRPIYECNLGLTYSKLPIPNWDEMIKHCHGAIELRRETPTDPYGLDYYYEFLAEGYFRAGKLKEFEELFEASGDLKDEPEKKAVVYNRIGNFFFSEYRWKESIRYYKNATKLAIHVAVYHANMGLALTELREWDEAEKAYQEALKLEPNNSAHHNGLGIVYYRSGDYQQAVDSYKRAIENDPKITIYRANLVLAYTGSGKVEDAEKACHEAIDIAPDDPVYQNDLGKAYEMNRDYRRAAEQYLKAIKLNPEAKEYLSNLVLACKQLTDLDKAVSLLESASKLIPDNPEIGQVIKGLKRK